LLLPAQVINEPPSVPMNRLLRPTFDLLWNGFGHPKSPNFDSQGNYLLAQ
jgi:hypothetical protein